MKKTRKPGRPKGSKNRPKTDKNGPYTRSMSSPYAQGYVDGFLEAKRAVDKLLSNVVDTVDTPHNSW